MVLKRNVETIMGWMRGIAPMIPLTNPYYIIKGVFAGKVESILDLGCGAGMSMRYIRRFGQFSSVGADWFLPLVKEARAGRLHDEYVLCDAKALPFKHKTFDVVICLDVVEHIEKSQAERLLCDIERVARKRVVLSTPTGFQPRDNITNPNDKHRSGWYPLEFKRRGYAVHTIYIRNHGSQRLEGYVPAVLKPIWYAVNVMAGVVTAFIPSLAGHMVCVKKLESRSILL